MQQQANNNGMAAEGGMGQAQAMAQHQYNPTYQGMAAQQVLPTTSLLPMPATTMQTSQVLAAGLFGLVVVGSGTMGANLHKVSDGDMTMGEAVSQSLSKGAVGGLATAAATAASTALTGGGLLGLAVTVATATGVSYLLSKP